MKLLYATSIDLPSTRANRLQVVSMAQAFEQLLGDNFVLGLRVKDIKYRLDLHYIETGSGRSYSLAWRYLIFARRGGFSHIYCREEKLLFFMILYNQLFFRLPIKFCYEIHHLVYLNTWWHRYILNYIMRVISITRGMKNELVASGCSEQNIFVAPDAVNITAFDIEVEKSEARRRLCLPEDKILVLYTGTIDEPWKGVGVLYEAAKHLGEDYLCVIVGGKSHYVEEFNRLHPPLSNVLLVGHRQHNEIPIYLKAADVLALPNSAKAEISRISTSPMKLFEYMASGVPIVASHIPSISEILNEKNAQLVAPDDAEALCKGIRILVGNPSLGIALATQARKDVSIHTWEKRASAILEYI